MTSHSPEPWRAGQRPGTIVSAAAGPGKVPHVIAESVSPENMRRILICVNTFRHIPITVIETFGLELFAREDDPPDEKENQ